MGNALFVFPKLSNFLRGIKSFCFVKRVNGVLLGRTDSGK